MVLYIVMLTHVTPHDVLYELRKVTFGTKRRDSCSSSLLLSTVPNLARQYTAKNGAQVEVKLAH